jgi:hypothetical protein
MTSGVIMRACSERAPQWGEVLEFGEQRPDFLRVRPGSGARLARISAMLLAPDLA